MNHEQLCDRALRWLRGTRRCNPVFSNLASCAEIPDAIGWSSCYQWHGSTVVECKTSLSDFRVDKNKYLAWKDPIRGYRFPRWRIVSKQLAAEQNLQLVRLASMGDFRFYFCLPGVLSEQLIADRMPDHGLLWLDGRSVRIIRPAPRRTKLVDKDGEIRYLRFAILNGKKPFCELEPTEIENYSHLQQ